MKMHYEIGGSYVNLKRLPPLSTAKQHIPIHLRIFGEKNLVERNSTNLLIAIGCTILWALWKDGSGRDYGVFVCHSHILWL